VYIHGADNPEVNELEAYPTAAAVRAKEQRTEKEKDWLEAGDKASIKESRKKETSRTRVSLRRLWI